jgi:hypothetical protein
MDAAVSLHCARCDYDLRMIDPAGACPECALPIADTLKAAAEPLAPDRRRIHRAVTVLLAAMAGRLIVGAYVLAYHSIVESDIVYPSIISQLLNLWPVDTASYCVLRLFRPINGWIFVRVSVFAYFALTCAGIALLTWRPAARDRSWAALLRPLALWSAVAGVAYILVLCAAMDHNWRRIYDPLGSNWIMLSMKSIPPAALAAWTVRLLIRSGIPPSARKAAAAAVVVTALAGIYNCGWPYSRGGLARLGLAANVATFAGMCWMWWELRRRTRPPAATMP